MYGLMLENIPTTVGDTLMCLSLAQCLGSNMFAALPGYHALTGSEYTAALFIKGTIRPLSVMEKLFMPVFVKLGTSQILDPDVIYDLESFVCHLYIMKCQIYISFLLLYSKVLNNE